MRRYTEDGLYVIREETIEVFNRDAMKIRESMRKPEAIKIVLRKIKNENPVLHEWCSQYIDHIGESKYLNDAEKDKMATGFINGIVHFYEFFSRQASINKLERISKKTLI